MASDGWKASMDWLEGMTRNETARGHLGTLRAALEAADTRAAADQRCWDLWKGEIAREQQLFARLLKALGMGSASMGDALEAACITIETVTEQARQSAEGRAA